MLPANEVYQFGFKLAARAGNSTIYPIDADDPSLIDDKSASGKRINGYLMANFTKIPDPVFKAFVKHSDSLEKTGTYLDLLRQALQYLNAR